MSLETLLTFSVGIGRNWPEADRALLIQAKPKKANNPYNIELYSGKPIQEGTRQPNPEVIRLNESMAFYNKIILDKSLPQDLREEAIIRLEEEEKRKRDPLTGLLNRAGYELELQKREQQEEYKNTYTMILLFDGNNMHGLNELCGYDGVSEILSSCGETIKNSIRTHEPSNKNSRERRMGRMITDLIACRPNNSTGDEFLAHLFINSDFCPSPEDADTLAKNVANRVLSNIYEMQRKEFPQYFEMQEYKSA